MNHPTLTAITRYQNHPKPSIHRETMQHIMVRPKRLHSTLQPRLSASSFNSLINLLLAYLPQVFRAIECFSERLLSAPLWDKQCKNFIMSTSFHSARVVYPHQNNQKPLPASTLQPRRSGMFFRWAGTQKPDSQILAIHANRVQELKENNGFIGFHGYRISMTKFW